MLVCVRVHDESWNVLIQHMSSMCYGYTLILYTYSAHQIQLGMVLASYVPQALLGRKKKSLVHNVCACARFASFSGLKHS